MFCSHYKIWGFQVNFFHILESALYKLHKNNLMSFNIIYFPQNNTDKKHLSQWKYFKTFRMRDITHHWYNWYYYMPLTNIQFRSMRSIAERAVHLSVKGLVRCDALTVWNISLSLYVIQPVAYREMDMWSERSYGPNGPKWAIS